MKLERPVEALDLHLAYWSYCGTAGHQQDMEAFSAASLRSANKTLKLATGWGTDPRDELNHLDTFMDFFMETETSLVNRATTIFVSPDVADLTGQMGEAMPPDMLLERDLPCDSGFAVLGSVWTMTLGEHSLPVRAIAWDRIDAVPTTGFDDDGEAVASEGEPGVYVMIYADSHHAPLGLRDQWTWEFNVWWEDTDDEDQIIPQQHLVNDRIGLLRRQLLCLWRFMNEDIVRTERTRMPRPARRRWDHSHKADVPEDGCIVSIHLRRYEPKARVKAEDSEGNVRWWSHRFWVRGHLRFCRKCGTDHPRQKHEWVRPHLFPNDPSLPIVIKERLISVDR